MLVIDRRERKKMKTIVVVVGRSLNENTHGANERHISFQICVWFYYCAPLQNVDISLHTFAVCDLSMIDWKSHATRENVKNIDFGKY